MSGPGNTSLLRLLPHHRAELERSGLCEKTIARWGAYSIESDQKWPLTELGFPHLDPPVLALPILPPDRTAPDLNDVIVKADRPRLGAHGQPIKYECRPRSRNRIHAPLAVRDGLGDLSIPLLITEGAKKAEKAAQEGLCCVAISGVWNGLDRIGTDSFPLGDFDSIPVVGRHVVLCFDSDAIENLQVRRAERGLGALLGKRGAHVAAKRLPVGPSGEKVGLEDFLLNHSVENFWKLPEEPIQLKPDVCTLISELIPESAKDRRRVLELISAESDPAERGRPLKLVAKRLEIPLSDHRAVVGRSRARARAPRKKDPAVGANGIIECEPDSDTDLKNAKRLVSRHGQDLRHCQQMGWIVWDDTRWAKDKTGEVERRAKNTAVAIHAEAAAAMDEDDRQALAKWAHRSQSESKIRAMVSLAESELGVVLAASQLDADPWLLNCPNGTIDLRSGELCSHRRGDLITKMVPVNYDPHASCPRFQDFLTEIMGGNLSLVEYLWRLLGYALTGDTSEQVLHLLYSTGSNGKTTLVETYHALLGDYAAQADFSTFLSRKQDQVRNDIARLTAVRFVSATEVESGRRLDEVVVKTLTGGDTVPARFLYHEFFEFHPQFKLFLSANHKPYIRGTDNAIWRRIRLVNFAITIPPERQDRQLKEKLRAELPGILAWLVEGCLAWQRRGLNPPREVVAATDTYRDEMDSLADFLAERRVVDPRAKARAGDLYKEFTAWNEDRSADSLSQKAFGMRLAERGFQGQKDSQGGRWWHGVGLKGA